MSRSANRLLLTAAGLLGLLTLLGPMGRLPPPGVRVTLAPGKAEYFIGEAVVVHLEIHNGGPKPVDYRVNVEPGSYFFVAAVHDDGTAAPDPHPNFIGGGSSLVTTKTIKPGGMLRRAHHLQGKVRLDKPGRYRVTVTDYDVTIVNAKSPTTAETTVTLREPTATEVERVVAKLDVEYAAGLKVYKGRLPPLDGYEQLAHMAYLPAMEERARGGFVPAVSGVGVIPDVAATRVLVELLGHADPEIVTAAELYLKDRLPYPADLEEQSLWYARYRARTLRAMLSAAAWRPEFAPTVRAHARRLLATGGGINLSRGAEMLESVGTAEDAPALLAGLDAGLAAALRPPGPGDYAAHLHYVWSDVRDALRQAVARGAVAPAAPKTGGELIFFVEAVGARPAFRPPGWAATFAAALRDPSANVRRSAVERAPAALPADLKALVPALLRDPDEHVRAAAYALAGRVKAPEWKAAIVETLKSAQDEALIRAAGGAARKFCDPLELIELYAAKIADEKAARFAVEALMMIFHDYAGGSNGIYFDPPDRRAECLAAWRQFVAENRETLKRPAPFSILDAIPRATLFPGHLFSPPRRAGSNTLRDLFWE